MALVLTTELVYLALYFRLAFCLQYSSIHVTPWYSNVTGFLLCQLQFLPPPGSCHRDDDDDDDCDGVGEVVMMRMMDIVRINKLLLLF